MEVNNGQQYFDCMVVDSDTALYQAARYVEEDYILVKHKVTGVTEEWRLVTDFRGKKKNEDEGWIGWLNNFVGTDLKRDDFEITQHVRLKKDMTNHLEEAEKQFSYFVGGIKATGLAKDYLICLGGEGNFRYDIANILPYKGERKDKPLIFQELKDKVLEQYKSKVELAQGVEADDLCAIYGAKNQAIFKKTGKYKYLLAYIDKDIKQVWGPTLFWNKKEEGVKFITPFDAAYHFCFQLLVGDKGTDNIPGLPNITPELREKYGIRKGNGCGERTAEGVLKNCTEVKELFERVIECYKAHYCEPKYKFTCHRGQEWCYTWKDYLSENARLLYMLRTPNTGWCIFKDLLTKLGVEYE